MRSLGSILRRAIGNSRKPYHRRPLGCELLSSRIVLDGTIDVNLDFGDRFGLEDGGETPLQFDFDSGTIDEPLSFHIDVQNTGPDILDEAFVIAELTGSAASPDFIDVTSPDLDCSFFNGGSPLFSCSVFLPTLEPEAVEDFTIDVVPKEGLPSDSTLQLDILFDAFEADEVRFGHSFTLIDDDSGGGGNGGGNTGNRGDLRDCTGMVRVKVDGTTAKVIGDSDANCLSKTEDGFSALGNTSIKFIGEPPNPADITDVIFRFKQGDDKFFLQPGDYNYNGKLMFGGGNDTLSIDGSNVNGNFTARFGPGNDQSAISNSNFFGLSEFKYAAGNDEAALIESSFESINIHLGNGADIWTSQDSNWGDHHGRAGRGADTIESNNDAWTTSTWRLGGGRDEFNATGSFSTGSTSVFGGKKSDIVSLFDSTLDTLSVHAGQGGDFVNVDGSEVDKLFIELNAGDDEIQILPGTEVNDSGTIDGGNGFDVLFSDGVPSDLVIRPTIELILPLGP